MSVTPGFAAAALEQPKHTKGEEIRAKIAANRARRLAIADAMKREAGVTGHEVNREDFGGLAFLGTGRIRSPEGRKILQLWTVAHECGHIFLHSSAPGISLPTHVQEMEAESYAHQCFREHGMTLPRRLSKWGRTYVGSWIEKDRSAGIRIDPRVEAYVKGRRSPYERLRFVPPTWKIHCGEPPTPTLRLADFRQLIVEDRFNQPNAISSAKISWVQELRDLLALCRSHLLVGFAVAQMALLILDIFYPMPELFPNRSGEVTMLEVGVTVIGSLIWTNLVVVLRTMTR